MMRHKILAALAICLLTSVAPSITAHAAPQPGVTVSPATVNVTFQNTETTKTIPLTLTNSYSVPVRLTAEFRGIDTSRGLLIPTDNLEADLTNNLHISQTDVTVPAGGTARLTVAIDKDPTLSPGGHYATLVLTQQSTEAKASNLRASLSVGMFIVRADGASSDIRLQDIRVGGGLLSLPSTVDVTLKNSGNLHAVPHGAVTIFTGSGELLAKGIVNENSQVILPGKSLTGTVTMSTLFSAWHPERLTITTQYRTGRGEGVEQQSQQRLYVPPVFIILCLGILALAVGAAYTMWRFRHTLVRFARRLRRR